MIELVITGPCQTCSSIKPKLRDFRVFADGTCFPQFICECEHAEVCGALAREKEMQYESCREELQPL